jgi:DNA-binding PadR family transcriptional regulator
MFEQELEMEKRVSSIVPLLLIVALIIAIVGVSLYFVAESKKVLSTQEATPVVLAAIDNQGPVLMRFQTGELKTNSNESPTDPHYRLLEKAGYLNIGKLKNGKATVTLTTKGEAWLADIAGVKKSMNKDGNNEYGVPLAQRKLVSIDKVTMQTPSKAIVEYTWKWELAKGGELFDAAGPAVKAFNTWDRSTLIDKHGANFYHEAPPRVALSLLKGDKGWQVFSE